MSTGIQGGGSKKALSRRARRARKSSSGGRPQIRQLTFEDGLWGGAREGAGRKRGSGAGVPHGPRERFKNLPVHITMRLIPDLNGLRHPAESEVVRGALAAGREKEGFRLVQYSIQWDHLHLLAEAVNEFYLAQAAQGLGVRLAKRLNRLWDRAGSVFAERHHTHPLRDPFSTFHAQRYVLCNGRKHGAHFEPGPDPLSSGPAFRHWSDIDPSLAVPDECVVEPTLWLLTTGWLLYGRPFASSEIPPRSIVRGAPPIRRNGERILLPRQRP
jgi:putative transposase